MNMKRGTGVPAMEFQGHAFHSRGGVEGRGGRGVRETVSTVSLIAPLTALISELGRHRATYASCPIN